MILCNEPLWSFESVRSINTQDRFTHFDYVRVLRQSGKLDQDSKVVVDEGDHYICIVRD